jgi:hypothetical protein
MAVGLLSGQENPISVAMFVRQVAEQRGNMFGTNKWRLDGHGG